MDIYIHARELTYNLSTQIAGLLFHIYFIFSTSLSIYCLSVIRPFSLSSPPFFYFFCVNVYISYTHL